MRASVAKRKLTKCERSIANKKCHLERNRKAKRDKFIIDYLPLVKYVVGRLMIYLPSHIDKEDLIESGVIGLIEAAEKFNEKKRVKFKTYAYHRIRGAILDYLRLQDWVPRSVREKDNIIKETYNSLEQKLNRPPQAEEAAEALGISCSEFEKMLSEINLCSLLYLDDIDFKNEDNSDVKGKEVLKDSKASEPLDILELREEQTAMEHAIKELSQKERMVITLYYYEEMLLKEIAKVMNLSESRVSQLHHRALLSISAKVNKTSAT